ncbi:MAG: GAF domain-containing protein, partial [Gillisia sp.]
MKKKSTKTGNAKAAVSAKNNSDEKNISELLKQREAELELINSVQKGLAEQMDIQGIYDLVGDKIRDIFDAQVTGIYSFDLEKGMENFHYLFEDGERLFPDPRPLNQIRNWIIKNKSLLLVNEDANNKTLEITGEKQTAVPGTRLPKSMLFVPLIVGNEVKGCVSLQNLDKENAFSDSDVQLLSTIANSMSVALENARLFNETEQRNAELAVINSVQEGLVAEMDMQGIYDLVGDRIRDLFESQIAIIATLNTENGIEYFNYLFEDGKRVEAKPRNYDKIRQRIVSTKKMLNIEENVAEAYTTITGNPPEAVPGTKFPLSVVFVPLLVGDSVRGYVSLQNTDKEYAFSESDVQLLNTLANSMSVALQNARLFNETEQRNAELAVINSVQQGLVAEMDMQGIYDLVGERVRQLFDAEVIAIVTLNLEEEKEYFQYAFEEGERIYPSGRPYDNIRKKIINEKSSLLIGENAAEVMSEINGKPFKPVPGTRMAKSALYVPMIVGDKVQGYVTLQNNDRENAFDDADVRLLTTLANSMSVALENARLFNETEQRNAELAVINSVQQGLVAEMDMQGIYDLVGDKIRDLFDAQVTAVCTFNYESNKEEFHYIFEEGERFNMEPRPIDKLRQKLIDGQELIYINENADEVWESITGEKPTVVPGTQFTKSALYVPMIVGKEVRGYVSLQNVDRENAFTDSDIRLLSTLANSMTVALENARLFNETEQRNAELAVINSVQEGLVAEMDMQGIYDLVGDKIRKLFDAQVTAVATFNHENSTEEFHYIFEDGQRFEGAVRPLDKIRQRLIDTQQLLYINENADEEWTKITGEKIVAVPGTKNAKSLLFVPMMVGKEVRGYVSLQNLDKENAFSDNDVRLLNTLVNSMSVALENARLFNETEQRNAELAVIN